MYFFTEDKAIHNPHLRIVSSSMEHYSLIAEYGDRFVEYLLEYAPLENCQKCLHDIQDLMQRGVTIIPKDFYTPYKV